MFPWVRMALAMLLMLMPGGIVFLISWALARAYVLRFRQAAAAPDRSTAALVRALASVGVRDIMREARYVSGFGSTVPGR
jgi:hypothetical protein